MSSPFAQWTDRDIADLIAAYPLAWVVSAGGGYSATPLPMLLETDMAGKPVSLLGHFAKANPQVDRIRADPRTLFLFTGPQGYVSPELIADRGWAPTWNYAVARIVADVTFDEELNDEAIATLVGKMERGRAVPWTTSEMGPRYDQLKQHIVAFRAPIVDVDARFKLGQDERPEVLAQILGGHDDAELVSWMQRFNPGRC